MSLSFRFFFLLIGLLAVAPASAADNVMPFAADPEAPVEIESDTLEVDNANDEAVFSGAVVARQGPLQLEAERMTVFYQGEGGQRRVMRLEAEQQVRLNSAQGQQAEGTKAVYEVDSRILLLSGPVVLKSGDHVLAGERLHVDLKAGQSRLEGGEKRVRGIFRTQEE